MNRPTDEDSSFERGALMETDFDTKDGQGGKMALKDLRQLTGELEELAQLLRQETRPQARMIIMRRVHEIMKMIGEGMRG